MIKNCLEAIIVRILNFKLFRFFMFRASLLATEKFLKVNRIEELKFMANALSRVSEKKSQLNQDLWVLYKSGNSRGGFFVEVGACHPVRLSNTYLLETNFDWQGLLIEPNTDITNELEMHRKSKIVPVAVGAAGTMKLQIAKDPEFSQSQKLNISQKHKGFKSTGRSIDVQVIPLSEIFSLHKVPSIFEFLSVDVEGAELDVLMSNDWTKWRPRLLVVEHNFRKDRTEIKNFLLLNGYQLSKDNSVFSWDDWYEDSSNLYAENS